MLRISDCPAAAWVRMKACDSVADASLAVRANTPCPASKEQNDASSQASAKHWRWRDASNAASLLGATRRDALTKQSPGASHRARASRAAWAAGLRACWLLALQ